MAAVKNQRIYSRDRELLKRINEEARVYLGRDTKLDLQNGVLTIFALPRPKMKYCKGHEKELPLKQFTKRVRWMREALCRKCELAARQEHRVNEDPSRV